MLFARVLAFSHIGAQQITLSMPNVTGLELGGNDYLTAAFYAFYASGPDTRLRIVAIDKTRHYFSETPP